ncbi:MAG: zinc dependent phospholipase C family protein [Bacilli bacterium]|nr:zinc dependent phospholipase C family protein [Bacilli bacterium]
MASALIHMAVAEKLNKKLKRRESEYLIGSIAPDVARIIGMDRNITHFQTDDEEYPNLERFLEKYEKDLNNDFVMGYYIHLLTDYFWYKYFYTEIVNENTITKTDGSTVKLTEDEIRKLIYNDYTNLNMKLIEEYNLNLKIFYNEIPKLENIIEEMPIDKIDKLIEKIGIIIENTKVSKTYMFNMEDVKKFIDTCIDLITAILEEKGIL